jgi:hypothetical protein
VTGVSIRLLAPDDDAAAIGEMEDPRPRQAIEQARAWVRGEITMSQARTAGGHAMAAARDLSGAARHAAYAAGQAAVVAHVAAHELANRLRELIALPPALESPCALAHSFGAAARAALIA